jgi:NfeD-like.
MPALAWILIATGCAVLEFLLSSFRFIWLAVAGLFVALAVKIGLIPALADQLLTFMIISAILLFFVRPPVLRQIKKRSSDSRKH